MSFSGFVRPYASSSRLSLTHGARNVTPANDRHDSTSSESHPRSFRKKKKKDIVFLATIKTRLNFIKIKQTLNRSNFHNDDFRSTNERWLEAGNLPL